MVTTLAVCNNVVIFSFHNKGEMMTNKMKSEGALQRAPPQALTMEYGRGVLCQALLQVLTQEVERQRAPHQV